MSSDLHFLRTLISIPISPPAHTSRRRSTLRSLQQQDLTTLLKKAALNAPNAVVEGNEDTDSEAEEERDASPFFEVGSTVRINKVEVSCIL